MVHLRQALIMDYTPNELALLDLISNVNNIFSFVGGDDECKICDGDIRQLDKAVKRFKTTIWENQLWPLQPSFHATRTKPIYAMI